MHPRTTPQLHIVDTASNVATPLAADDGRPCVGVSGEASVRAVDTATHALMATVPVRARQRMGAVTGRRDPVSRG
jgi:hypothetical protein